MHLPTLLSPTIVALGLTCLTAAATPGSFRSSFYSSTPVIPGAYFIELHAGTSSLTTREIHASFAQRVKRDSAINLSIRHSYTSSSTPDAPALFNGLSANLESNADVGKIQALPEVKRVFPVRLVSRPRINAAEYTAPGQSRGNNSVGPDWPTNLTVPVHGRRQVSTVEKSLDWNWVHSMTGVDKVHEKNVFGEGVRVAVIDTGVDYRHPALGGCFGSGCKVSFGYDFVGDQYGNVSYTPEPKPDPLVTCYQGFHGTHVTGSIIMEVGQNSSVFQGLTGVAPKAELGMYRVFGCVGSAGDDVILAALSKAADDGAHVISMSLGEYSPYSQYLFSSYPEVIPALKQRGIAVVAAAGNDGSFSPFYLEDPGISAEALAVASIETSHFATYTLTRDDGVEAQYGALYPFPRGEYKVIVLETKDGSPYSAYGCAASDYPTADQLDGDISQYIVVFRRGLCTLSSIQSVAAAAGFSQALAYPDPDQSDNVFINGYAVPTPAITANNTVYNFATLSREDGLDLVKRYNATSELNITISEYVPTLVEQPGGGKPNNFSSVGPTMDFKLKPQVGAPGGMILSTFPISGDGVGFGIISGTSMATPYLSGVYALVKSRNPKLSVDEIFDIIKSTAAPITMSNYDAVSPAPQQGGGLVQADAAVFPKSLVTPSELNVPSTSRIANTTLSISITNPSSSDVTYSLANFPAAGMAMFPEALNWPGEVGYTDSRFYRLEALPFHADLGFSCDGASCTKLTVGAGQTSNITVSVAIDEQPETMIPIYSGFINITSDAGDALTIPYTGPAYDYANAALYGLQTPTQADLANAWNANRSLFTAPQVYVTGSRVDMGQYRVFNFTGLGDTPCLLSTTLQPLQWLRIDAVRWNTSIVPTYYGYDTKYRYPNLTDPRVPDNGTVGAGPIVGSMYLENGPRPEFSVNAPMDTTLADAEVGIWSIGLYKGSYRILQQAVRFGVDASDPSNWETWLGPVIDIPRDVTVV